MCSLWHNLQLVSEFGKSRNIYSSVYTAFLFIQSLVFTSFIVSVSLSPIWGVLDTSFCNLVCQVTYKESMVFSEYFDFLQNLTAYNDKTELLSNRVITNTHTKIEILTSNIFLILTLGSSNVAPTKLITYELLSFDKMATSLQNMSTSDLAPNEFPLYLKITIKFLLDKNLI